MTQKFFIDRRSGDERRSADDQRKNPRLDLPHKRRRKAAERRGNGSMADDFYATQGMEADDFRPPRQKH